MSRFIVALVALGASCTLLRAWDYEGHRLVNQLALASLPTNFPAFVHPPAAQERVAFLAGEPDRWRNTPDQPMRHYNGPDHYIDLEDLAAAGLDAKSVSPFRYEFAAQLALARAQHPTNFPPIDPARNADRTRELAGFLPWAITEYYSKLKSAFSYLKTFEETGTPEEIANAQQNVLYLMGVMGHFVGDATQPLHTTRHFNGWVGENPHHYTTSQLFHAWIDGGFLHKAGVNLAELRTQLRPARLVEFNMNARSHQEDVFPVVMSFILEQHKLVEPLYQFDTQRKLSRDGDIDPQGHEFINRQLRAAGQMLGDLWLTAWQHAPPDTFLKASLAKRRLAAETAPDHPKTKTQN
jgi:hypothetical protein